MYCYLAKDLKLLLNAITYHPTISEYSFCFTNKSKYCMFDGNEYKVKCKHLNQLSNYGLIVKPTKKIGDLYYTTVIRS